ncbi:hypothetical protein [Enterococcus gallinarum]|uniref:hypothetical protein n=1 Tax=Enterococcus gallinarum TaxID=1353 RepID=UPI001AD6057B|nr:hypothetical protein [Enterococcus gallinarum]MBO6419915.1 hypothetical protein [Enterococcus gallinarum]MBO6423565.1 hypothetical protein [Enterococcus gallinarum]
MFGLFKKKNKKKIEYIEYVSVPINTFGAYKKAILGGNLRVTLENCRLFKPSGLAITVCVHVDTSHEDTADFWRKRLENQGLKRFGNTDYFEKVMHSKEFLKEFDTFVSETFDEYEETR